MDGGNLVFSCFCPDSIWGPSPPSSLAIHIIHIGILWSFISSPWLDRAADPTQPALFLSCVSTV